eukprot:1071277-Alexandrium_andersonii.AAC.1
MSVARCLTSRGRAQSAQCAAVLAQRAREHVCWFCCELMSVGVGCGASHFRRWLDSPAVSSDGHIGRCAQRA